jgi:hypothetical protein
MDDLAVGPRAGCKGRGGFRVRNGYLEEAKRGEGVEAETAEHRGEEMVGDAKIERLYSGEALKG